jgi:DNA-directed RNA polymerase specialized sigma24 family protein
MSQVLKKIACKHKDWVRMVVSFGCSKSIAEDIVQEMYLKIHDLLQKGLDISYGDDVNYYYIYRTLKNSYYIYSSQESKIQKVGMEFLELVQEENTIGNQKDVLSKMKKLNKVLNSVYWYDRKVFEIISNGTSIAELSRKTNISYASLYNTYRNVKDIIKNNIQWD